MSWIISGILLIILVILIIKQNQKIIVDRTEANKYKLEIEQLLQQKQDLQKDIRAQTDLITDYQEKILAVQNKYKEEFNKKNEDLDTYFANQRLVRQSEMDADFERQLHERKENLNLRINELKQQFQDEISKTKYNTTIEIERLKTAQNEIMAETLLQEKRFDALIEPLKQYEKEKQEQLYYTIQVPDEYKQDIDFLLNTVSQKIQHPDIINKLVWAEYVKPYIDETFKRVNIKDEPGIYKLTNIGSGKCYIGKSTNVKKRIADHFKSSVGMKTIADQAIHHEILKTGFWNWTIELIIYCDKKELNDLEKYYIQFFKSNIFGFNKTNGGEG